LKKLRSITFFELKNSSNTIGFPPKVFLKNVTLATVLVAKASAE
jgi:hypothetical protein